MSIARLRMSSRVGCFSPNLCSVKRVRSRKICQLNKFRVQPLKWLASYYTIILKHGFYERLSQEAPNARHDGNIGSPPQ